MVAGLAESWQPATGRDDRITRSADQAVPSF
jgi:hypothetical protein